MKYKKIIDSDDLLSDSIKFDKHTPIIIYGAGDVGRKLAIKLINNMYNLLCFVDKNKVGIDSQTQIPIYKMGVDSFPIYNSECVIIICLADGMQHKVVASQLIDIGFHYIIFLPLNLAISSEKKYMLSIRYNRIMEGDFSTVTEVEKIDGYFNYNLSCENAIIEQFENSLTVWCREEMVYSEDMTKGNASNSTVLPIREVQDILMVALDEYSGLFSYFRGNNYNVDSYWNARSGERTNEQKTQEIYNREKLFRVFESEYSKGMDFFIASAPDAVWNVKGYFNFQGGHHRTSFLQEKGHVLLPMKISKKEFEHWCNIEKFNKLKEYIYLNNIHKTTVPIPHPAFIDFEVDRELYGETILSSVFRFFRYKIKSLRSFDILDCSHMDGYLARNFARQKKGITVYADTAQNIEFAKLINELLYVTDIEYHEIHDLTSELNINRTYSAVFLINRDDIDLSDEYFQKKICNVTKNYLFVETVNADQADIEKFIGNTDFSDCDILHREVYNGKQRQVYVFSK